MESIAQSGPSRYNYQYYRLNQNNTTITESPVKDFKLSWAKPASALTLGPDILRFVPRYGQIIERVKGGALTYVEQTDRRGSCRMAGTAAVSHGAYEDLNIHLVNANIQKMKSEIWANAGSEYKPFKIAFDYHDKK